MQQNRVQCRSKSRAAIILAAGRGTRMKPFTEHTPKPLACVAGVPLIVYHLRNLASAGIHDIVINLGHLGEKIEQALGNGRTYGVNIRYSYEDPILETGGGIAKALSWLGSEPFIAVSGDVLTDFPFERLVIEPNKLAHLVLMDNPPHHLRGDYSLSDDGIVSDKGDILLNFSGIGLYRPELFHGCPVGAFRLPELFKRNFPSQSITGEYYTGLWYNIGTQPQLDQANEAYATYLKKTSIGKIE